MAFVREIDPGQVQEPVNETRWVARLIRFPLGLPGDLHHSTFYGASSGLPSFSGMILGMMCFISKAKGI